MCQVFSTIVMVGTETRVSGLHELPIRLLIFETGREAIQCLTTERIDSVISRWDLIDMPEGELLAKITRARPNMPTVAFIEPGNQQQEIIARSLGVTAILTDDIDDAYFRSTVCQILYIEDNASVSLSAAVYSD